MHHVRAAWLFGVVLVLDQALGAWFGHADGVGALDGMYWAAVTVTTVGYGDIVPHGWLPHLLALAVMVLVIPLWTGAFGLVTTGFVAWHIDRRHNQMKAHISGGRDARGDQEAG